LIRREKLGDKDKGGNEDERDDNSEKK